MFSSQPTQEEDSKYLLYVAVHGLPPQRDRGFSVRYGSRVPGFPRPQASVTEYDPVGEYRYLVGPDGTPGALNPDAPTYPSVLQSGKYIPAIRTQYRFVARD